MKALWVVGGGVPVEIGGVEDKALLHVGVRHRGVARSTPRHNLTAKQSTVGNQTTALLCDGGGGVTFHFFKPATFRSPGGGASGRSLRGWNELSRKFGLFIAKKIRFLARLARVYFPSIEVGNQHVTFCDCDFGTCEERGMERASLVDLPDIKKLFHGDFPA